ncbi:hypothetical protein ACJX0J_038897 [Zea mays]
MQILKGHLINQARPDFLGFQLLIQVAERCWNRAYENLYCCMRWKSPIQVGARGLLVHCTTFRVERKEPFTRPAIVLQGAYLAGWLQFESDGGIWPDMDAGHVEDEHHHSDADYIHAARARLTKSVFIQ